MRVAEAGILSRFSIWENTQLRTLCLRGILKREDSQPVVLNVMCHPIATLRILRGAQQPSLRGGTPKMFSRVLEGRRPGISKGGEDVIVSRE